MTRTRLLLLLLIAASTALRLAFVGLYPGFHTGDDVEILEAAFRVAVGLDFEPWAIRNLLLPELVVAPVVRAAAGLGLDGPGALVVAGILPFVGLGSVNLWLVYRLGRRWSGRATAGLVAAGVYAVHPLLLALASSASPRVASTTAVLAAADLISGRGSGRSRPLLRAAGAGGLLAIAFACRYSEIVFLAPLALTAVMAPPAPIAPPVQPGERSARRPTGLGRLGALTGGFALGVVLTVGLQDALAWGEPFASLREFADYTLVRQEASAAVREQPVWWYAWRLLKWVPFPLLGLLAFAPRERRARASWWLCWAWVLLPLVALSAVHHKDLRYVQGIVPFVCLLAALGAEELRRRGRGRVVAVLLLLTAAVGLSGGLGILDRKSMAAVAAARHLAAVDGVEVVVYSRAWSFGHRLYLGNEVGVREVPWRPSAAELEASLAGADAVALSIEELEAEPELEALLARHGLRPDRVFRRGRGEGVAVFLASGSAAP